MSDLQKFIEAIKPAIVQALEKNTKKLGGDYWNSGEDGVAECFYDDIANEAVAEAIKSIDTKSFKLIIQGFGNMSQVKAFADWYEGQGEQDASNWLECRKDEGLIDVSFFPVTRTPYIDTGNSLTITVKPM